MCGGHPYWDGMGRSRVGGGWERIFSDPERGGGWKWPNTWETYPYAPPPTSLMGPTCVFLGMTLTSPSPPTSTRAPTPVPTPVPTPASTPVPTLPSHCSSNHRRSTTHSPTPSHPPPTSLRVCGRW
eukprot:Sspe_Gene.96289::Locus_68892_Transcript_1_1_Confidence_1.000_Length_731::g.96289::m.96289